MKKKKRGMSKAEREKRLAAVAATHGIWRDLPPDVFAQLLRSDRRDHYMEFQMSGRLPDMNRHQCYVISDGKQFFTGVNVWLGSKFTTEHPAAAALFLREDSAKKKLDRMREYYRVNSAEADDFTRKATIYVLTMDISLKKV